MKCISNFSIFNTLNLKWLPCYAQSKQIPEWTICQIKIKMPFIRIGKGYFMPGMIVSKASDASQIWADILTTFCTNSEVKLSNSISSPFKTGFDGRVEYLQNIWKVIDTTTIQVHLKIEFVSKNKISLRRNHFLNLFR